MYSRRKKNLIRSFKNKKWFELKAKKEAERMAKTAGT
ncbi:MAG: hypothetical protein ACI936_000025 [Paraglaciecola sp.]|jgi:hypothetical protein